VAGGLEAPSEAAVAAAVNAARRVATMPGTSARDRAPSLASTRSVWWRAVAALVPRERGDVGVPPAAEEEGDHLELAGGEAEVRTEGLVGRARDRRGAAW
jgi:hypothetical protein